MKRTNKKLFKNFAEFEIVDKKNNVISMADYASVGKTWNKKSEVAVWMPVKK